MSIVLDTGSSASLLTTGRLKEIRDAHPERVLDLDDHVPITFKLKNGSTITSAKAVIIQFPQTGPVYFQVIEGRSTEDPLVFSLADIIHYREILAFD